MASILEQCQNFFGTKDLYELFSVSKTALEKDITKAYYKLALKVHPDRVSAEEKEEATEKFKVLTKLHLTLTTKDKRALYDEQGIVGDEEGESFSAAWYQFFKPISEEDINNFEKQYLGSTTERNDIKKAYMNGKGCLNFMFESVPFMTIESEPRIIGIVNEMIESKEVPPYDQFTNEPKAKRNRRHKKYKLEAEEVKKISSDMSSLEMQIMKRQNERKNDFASLLDRLADKYGDAEDDSEVWHPSSEKKRGKKKSQKRKSSTEEEEEESPAKKRNTRGRTAANRGTKKV